MLYDQVILKHLHAIDFMFGNSDLNINEYIDRYREGVFKIN